MKNKSLKMVMMSMVCICLMSNISFAATVRGESLTSVDEVSVLLPDSQTYSMDKSQSATRGEATAVCMLSISNEGSGVIGVVATTALYRNVDWGLIDIYLDRWNEEENGWEHIKGYETIFPNGNNNGQTTALTVSMDITDQPSGYYYRLRGVHEIEYKNDSNKTMWEGLSTCTDGVFITDTP